MSDTTLRSVQMRPGIVKDTTEYLAEGGWVDADHIRFRNGRPEKIGGWVKEITQQVTDPTNEMFTGVARDIISWTDLSGKKYLTVASHLKVEMLTDGLIYDITPVRETVALNNAISTTNTESEVQITDVNHNLVVGDYIFVTDQQTAVNGIDLAGEYTVTEVVDADNYKVDSGVAASGTTALSGGDLDIDYLLENGFQDNGNITGWGGGTWDTEGEAGGGYDRPRAGIGGSSLRLWSLDTWGEDLLANVRGGKIYQWDATNGPAVRMEVLTNAPEQNLFILVSQPSRHLIAFGSEVFVGSTFDPLIIRWATQESLTDWDITPTNTAGEYRLPGGNYIVGAVQTRSDILVFTDTTVYSMRYVGGNNIFQFDPLGTNISVVSQNAFVDINGVVFWQGTDNFYMYDGVVSVLPSTIGKYLFDQDGEGQINFDQKEKAYLGIIREFNEIIGLYPSINSTEIDSYWKYNYIEGVFDTGTLNRTVWLDRNIFPKPYAVDELGRLYVHEEGKDADGSPLEAYIRSSYFDIDDGEDMMFMDRVLPDVLLPSSRNMEITFFVKKYPHPGADIITKGPYFFDDTKRKISLRVRGRQVSVEYKVTATGSDFEIGKFRYGLQPDGER